MNNSEKIILHLCCSEYGSDTKSYKETINLKPIADLVEISDGYHTFSELYEHRFVLFIALCKTLHEIRGPTMRISDVWRSRLHSDGSDFPGWFLLGIDKRNGKQITYHLPNKYWPECDFAETLENAPRFDGHTSKDVLIRISNI